jgi:hypothetical protein
VHVLDPRPARSCRHDSTLERGEDGPAPRDPYLSTRVRLLDRCRLGPGHKA